VPSRRIVVLGPEDSRSSFRSARLGRFKVAINRTRPFNSCARRAVRHGATTTTVSLNVDEAGCIT
jgi:hypothetical protein